MKIRPLVLPYVREHKDDIREFGADMRRMAGPVIIEQAAAVLMNMISTMISAKLGDAAISAIGSVGTINMLVISVFSALSTGGTVVVAQYLGQKNQEKAEHSAAAGLLAMALLAAASIALLLIFREPLIRWLFKGADEAVIFLSITYLTGICFYYLPFGITSMGLALLRGAGDMRSPMIVSIITNAVNMLVAYPLIYGFAATDAGQGLGVTGSALAMIIAQSVGMILVLYILFTGKGRLSVQPREFLHPKPRILKNILFFGLPAGAEQVMFNGGKLITQIFIMGLGTASIAANTIVNTVSGFIGVTGNSLSIIATTMVGQFVGAGETAKARRWNFFITISSSLIFLLMLCLTIPGSSLLIRPFTKDPETAAIAVELLRVYVIVIPFLHAPSFTLPSGLRGAGDVRYTLIISMLSMWLLRVGMSYVLAIHFRLGVRGIWFGMYLDWLGRALFFIPRAFGQKWLQHEAIS